MSERRATRRREGTRTNRITSTGTSRLRHPGQPQAEDRAVAMDPVAAEAVLTEEVEAVHTAATELAIVPT